MSRLQGLSRRDFLRAAGLGAAGLTLGQYLPSLAQSDIQASIKQLSDTLIALQSLGSGDNSTAELSRIRDELDQSLAVAKVVEARINSLVEETDVKVHERPLQTNPQEKGKTL